MQQLGLAFKYRNVEIQIRNFNETYCKDLLIETTKKEV